MNVADVLGLREKVEARKAARYAEADAEYTSAMRAIDEVAKLCDSTSEPTPPKPAGVTHANGKAHGRPDWSEGPTAYLRQLLPNIKGNFSVRFLQLALKTRFPDKDFSLKAIAGALSNLQKRNEVVQVSRTTDRFRPNGDGRMITLMRQTRI